jgi:hypothetical protein
MLAVKGMPTRKRDERNAAGPPRDQPEKKAAKGNTGVKVSPVFKRRLKIIAAALDEEMGDLIEREMELFLSREEGKLREEMRGQQGSR